MPLTEVQFMRLHAVLVGWEKSINVRAAREESNETRFSIVQDLFFDWKRSQKFVSAQIYAEHFC